MSKPAKSLQQLR